MTTMYDPVHPGESLRDAMDAEKWHPLTGDRRDQWSVRVSGNWRIVFRFMDGVATDVDLIDYH